MRVNIYGEELTTEVDAVKKEAEGYTFYGIRFYLESSDKMYPPKHQDDDRSAVTFWSRDREKLKALLDRAREQLM